MNQSIILNNELNYFSELTETLSKNFVIIRLVKRCSIFLFLVQYPVLGHLKAVLLY